MFNFNELMLAALFISSAAEPEVAVLIKTLEDLVEVKNNYKSQMQIYALRVLTSVLRLKIF